MLRDCHTQGVEITAAASSCPRVDYVYENILHVNFLAWHEMKIFLLVMGGDKIINDDIFPISKYRHNLLDILTMHLPLGFL